MEDQEVTESPEVRTPVTILTTETLPENTVATNPTKTAPTKKDSLKETNLILEEEETAILKEEDKIESKKIEI